MHQWSPQLNSVTIQELKTLLLINVPQAFKSRSSEQNLVMLFEVVVGNRDGGGAHDCINQPIRASSEVAMVHPDVTGCEDVHGIAIGALTLADVGQVGSHRSRACDLEVVDVHSMDDHVGDELESQASSSGDVDVEASAIDGLEAGHDQLILELDVHVPCKAYPQRPLKSRVYQISEQHKKKSIFMWMELLSMGNLASLRPEGRRSAESREQG